MRALHIIAGGDTGGARTHIYNLLKSLTPKIDKATLVSMREGGFADGARALGIDTVVADTKNPVKLLSQLKKLVHDGNYDVIHCHGAKGNVTGVALGALTGLPVVSTIHSDPRKDYLGSVRKQLTNGLLNRTALRLVDYRIAVSRPFSRLLLDRGYHPEKLFILPNSFEFPDEPPETSRAGEDKRREYLARFGLGYDEGDVIVGIAARFDPVKDIPMLIKAFAHALEKAPNMRLLLGGDGEDKEKALLAELVSSLGLGERVAFTGWLSDVAEFFSVVDINTISSLSEGLPFSILEGVRQGAACVSTAVGGIVDVIDHGVNGFMTSPRDSAAFGDCLAELALDSEKRLRFRDALYRKCRRDYSLDAMSDKQIEIYESILRKESRPKRWRDGTVLCGAYGNNNVGDDAIMESLVTDLRGVDPDIPITILTRTPKATRSVTMARTIYTFNVLRLLPRLLRTRLFISGGGTLIQDQTSTRSIIYYLFTIIAARMCGAKVMLYGCGIGPVTHKFNRKFARAVLDKPKHTITLRERRSLDVLRSLGIDRASVTLTADPAFSLGPASDDEVDAAFLAAGMDPHGKYIGFAVRSWPGYDAHIGSIARAAGYAYKKYGLTPVFYPMSPPGDERASREVTSRMSCPVFVLKGGKPPRLTIGMLGRMRVVVSMRLHALIFAVSAGVSVVGLSYDAAKVAGFMEYLGNGLFCELSSLTPESLEELIDRAYVTDMSADADRLRELEKKNIEIAREKLTV